MKISAKLSSVSKDQLQQLSSDLKGILSDQAQSEFIEYVRPYDEFGAKQLDDIFLIAQVTIRGNGQVQSLTPDCSIDQEDWHQFEDEPDIRIDPVSIPLKLLTPQTPFDLSGSETFQVVMEAEGNIWDSCKSLPAWIWEEGKFEFMLMFSVTDGDGTIHYGNQGDEYASKLIEF